MSIVRTAYCSQTEPATSRSRVRRFTVRPLPSRTQK